MSLTHAERAQLLENIYHLNMQELKGFCDDAGIPYRISYEADDGRIAKIGDIDRKGVVLGGKRQPSRSRSFEPSKSRT